MKKFKAELKKELQIYFNKIDSIKDEYSKYMGEKGKAIYSPDLIRKKLVELDAKKDVELSMFKNKIDVIKDSYIEDLQPNYKVINTPEYQTKLLTTLALIELAGGKNITSLLIEIIENRDYTTLSILKDKYKTDELLIAYADHGPETSIKSMENTADTLKTYLLQLKNDNSFVPREVMLETLDK